ncbi:hypothetical protein N7495_006361 [Penicillium taxi]|uniref:uncharacterized protein n=1 Tax=Penicillium taxi TaxID=168475 RepID=UPI002545A1E5|nr:uncharacterized protein N7495_006361 [Penicillium taxi]KAJ5894670.1 hypothetical protein N7495_006361 [Penicillium taxi]
MSYILEITLTQALSGPSFEGKLSIQRQLEDIFYRLRHHYNQLSELQFLATHYGSNSYTMRPRSLLHQVYHNMTH